jgi:hypothetical protein
VIEMLDLTPFKNSIRELIKEEIKKESAKGPTSYLRLGTIPADYVSGRPRIIFDGEDAATSRTYPYLPSYVPRAGDRVVLAKVGHSWVILGRVEDSTDWAAVNHTHTRSQITDFPHKSTHASGGADALTPADIGAAPASHDHTILKAIDNRSVSPVPTDYDKQVVFEFKYRSAVGNPGTTGTYCGVMTFAPWSDQSGGSQHQIAFTEDGLFWRKGDQNTNTWSAWKQITMT